ncbi:single-stranded DNA-binding protein [Halobacteriovorax marinus]|uniref:Single-stranded DNA-binding protein n=1 Tax=Halobacteriovorax marinus TaxID=97084 RepID=A0A1Y5F605_9BACT|nr:single-stranded DNA-binding protein [Halobacteriovorax marinus]
MSLNKVMIIGRLGKDPELKYTPSGAAVCNFSVATSETWADKSGQKQEKTEWHNIVVWGKLAELCNQYLAKGRQAYVEGSLSTRSWEKDGVKRYSTEINAKTIQFLGGQQANAGQGQSRDGGYNQSAPAAQPQQNNAMNQDYDIATDSNFTSDDIPF